MATETITIEAPPEGYADPHSWRVGQFYQLMVEEMRAGFEGPYWRSMEGARLKKIATLLYLEADKYDDADAIMIAQPAFGPKSSVAIRGPFLPAWALYIAEAKRALDVVALADSQ